MLSQFKTTLSAKLQIKMHIIFPYNNTLFFGIKNQTYNQTTCQIKILCNFIKD